MRNLTNQKAVEIFFRDLGETPVSTPERTPWDSCRRINSIFSAGDTLYSYGPHFPMATILRDRDGKPSAIMINSDSASVTTAKHQGYVHWEAYRQALPVVYASQDWLASGDRPGWRGVAAVIDVEYGDRAQAVVADRNGFRWLLARPQYIRRVGNRVASVKRAWEALRR